MIYLIGQKKSWHQKPFKIGYSRDPVRRLLDLQTGHPYLLKIVKTWQGGRTHEKRIHSVLSDYKTNGGSEWFDPCLMSSFLSIKRLVDRSQSIESLVNGFSACPESSDIGNPTFIQTSIEFDSSPQSKQVPIKAERSYLIPASTAELSDMTEDDREWILHACARSGLIPNK